MRVNQKLGIAVKYWLMKSEPDEFSIDDFAHRLHEEWTGVRNYQARNFLREMQLGDQFFFYHSSCAEPGIVGIGKVARIAAADASQFEPNSPYFDGKSQPDAPRWSSVSCAFVRKLAAPIGLNRLRENSAALEGLALLSRGTRLSVTPITAAHWKAILKMEAS
jgi:predicted RNA-binding protein with PUA-like domain